MRTHPTTLRSKHGRDRSLACSQFGGCDRPQHRSQPHDLPRPQFYRGKSYTQREIEVIKTIERKRGCSFDEAIEIAVALKDTTD